jgi:hypothetical protein
MIGEPDSRLTITACTNATAELPTVNTHPSFYVARGCIIMIDHPIILHQQNHRKLITPLEFDFPRMNPHP